ncbi:MAG TPA: YihY/virulence factor BrkB family protein [Ktedonobacteraceae bacterium]
MQDSLQDTKRPNFLSVLLAKTAPLRGLFLKFSNDWDMTSASGLAYNLMTAMVPIFITLIAVFGLTIGTFDAKANADLIARIQQIFPVTLNNTGILNIVLTSLRQKAGFLGVLAVLAAIFGGSRLFVSIEGYFDIVYSTAPRGIIAQNIMAILMMLAFLVLIPLMVVASFIPALLPGLAQIPGLNSIPGIVQLTDNAFVLSIAGILVSLLISWIFFEVIYSFVPNLKLSFRHSWRGAVVAAIGLEVFLILFPYYITHLMGSYTGTAGFILILLVFFYYFAVILLVGAEINAYFALGIAPLPDNIAVVLQKVDRQKGNGQKTDEASPVLQKVDEPKIDEQKAEKASLVLQKADGQKADEASLTQ